MYFKDRLSSIIEPSGESLDFKLDTKFKDDLVNAFAEFRSRIPEVRADEQIYSPMHEVQKVIEKHTGLKPNVNYGLYDMDLAYMTIPPISKVHPLLAGRGFGMDHASKRIIKKKGKFEVTVDLKNGKVYGDHNEIRTDIVLGELLFEKLDDAELAAVCAHELGHMFAFYAYLSAAPTTNFVLKEFAQTVFETKNENERKVLVNDLEDALKIDFRLKNELLKANSREEITILALKTMVEESRSQFNANIYDQRSFEAIADQFSVRIGLGSELSSALRKIGVSGTSPAAQLILAVLAWIIPGGILLDIGLAHAGKIYDTPKKRHGAIRKEIMGRLKFKTSKQEREYILSQLDEIEEAIGKMGGVTMGEWIYDTVYYLAGSNYSSVKVQQALEDFRTSELRTSVIRLRKAQGKQ